jgi:hypothetical protein
MSKVVCNYTVVRYVPDPVRDEAKNLGVILVAEQIKWAAGRFQIPAYLRTNPTQSAFLDSLVERVQGNLAQKGEPDINRNELEALHRESSGVIQYRKPASALAEDPQVLLNELYRRLVYHTVMAPERVTRGTVVSRLTKIFKAHGVAPAIEPKPRVRVPGLGHVHFDIGLSNGSLKHVMEVVSFNRADVDMSEHTGAWFALVWPEAKKTLKAEGHLLLEPGESDEADQGAKRVDRWAKDAGIRVVAPEKLDRWAEDLAEDFAPVAGATPR